jgi:hypothetical protein
LFGDHTHVWVSEHIDIQANVLARLMGKTRKFVESRSDSATGALNSKHPSIVLSPIAWFSTDARPRKQKSNASERFIRIYGEQPSFIHPGPDRHHQTSSVVAGR